MNWRPLDWIDPKYEVSDTGLVRSWKKEGRIGGVRKEQRVLKQRSCTGYMKLGLYAAASPRVRKVYFVHRLVLRAFSGVSGAQVNHKDGVKDNNCIGNLEWCTASENMWHSWHVLGNARPVPWIGCTGARCANSKAVAQYTLAGKLVHVWDAQMDAKRAGFNQGKISAVCRGARPQHRGFVWAFFKQE